ncbi:unnamed protein product [Closterium sp. Naga37s-1]|nr:unnamed protein product [Closterium sp. Naga37s-1]
MVAQYWSGRKWARASSAREERADFAAKHRTHSPIAMGRVPPSVLARAMRREAVSSEKTSSGSGPWRMVLMRAWRWVVTAALAMAASLSLSPIPGLYPLLAVARLCCLLMPVALGGDSSLPYMLRPFGVVSVAPALSVPVALVAAMSAVGSPAHASCSTLVDSGRGSAGVSAPPRVMVPTPVPPFVLAPAAVVAPPHALDVAPSPAPHVPVLASPAAAAAGAVEVEPASGEAPLPAPVQAPPPVAAVALPWLFVLRPLMHRTGSLPLRSPWLPRLRLPFPRLCSIVTPALIFPPHEMNKMCLGVGVILLAGGSHRRTGLRPRVAGGEVAVAGVAGGRPCLRQLQMYGR